MGIFHVYGLDIPLECQNWNSTCITSIEPRVFVFEPASSQLGCFVAEEEEKWDRDIGEGKEVPGTAADLCLYTSERAFLFFLVQTERVISFL